MRARKFRTRSVDGLNSSSNTGAIGGDKVQISMEVVLSFDRAVVLKPHSSDSGGSLISSRGVAALARWCLFLVVLDRSKQNQKKVEIGRRLESSTAATLLSMVVEFRFGFGGLTWSSFTATALGVSASILVVVGA